MAQVRVRACVRSPSTVEVRRRADRRDLQVKVEVCSRACAWVEYVSGGVGDEAMFVL